MEPRHTPPHDPPGPTRTERFAVLWPLVRDVAAFLLAAFILSWETIERSAGDPVLVGAGVALMGIPVVSAVKKAADRNGAS